MITSAAVAVLSWALVGILFVGLVVFVIPDDPLWSELHRLPLALATLGVLIVAVVWPLTLVLTAGERHRRGRHRE